MSLPTNEFSDLERSAVSPDGTAFEFVCQVGYGVSGWGILRGKAEQAQVPIVIVRANGARVHQEPATDRNDAERIIDDLVGQVRAGTFKSD